MITLTDETAHKSRDAHEKRTTKSGGYSRSFPIQDELRNVLGTPCRLEDGKVFHGPLDGKIKADTVRRILIRDVLTPLASRFSSSGSEPGLINGRLHSFRHYFCSNWANVGVKERVLMSWLGHPNSKTVHRYYHLHDDEFRRQMDRVKLY